MHIRLKSWHVEANSYILLMYHAQAHADLDIFTVRCSGMQYLLRQLLKTAVITNLQNILFIKLLLIVKKIFHEDILY